MPKKVDSNQKQIVQGLRLAGVMVTDLHVVGKGCPDILCSWRKRFVPMEIKSEGGKLTPDEIKWHSKQRAKCPVVYNLEDALIALGILPERLKESKREFLDTLDEVAPRKRKKIYQASL